MSIPAGSYRIKAIAVDTDAADNDGNPQVAITFSVPEQNAQAKIHLGMKSDKAFDFTMKALQTLGYTGSDPLGVTLKELPAEAIGIFIEDAYEDRRGAKRSDVRLKYINDTEYRGKKLDKDQKEVWREKMKQKAAAFVEKNPVEGEKPPF